MSDKIYEGTTHIEEAVLQRLNRIEQLLNAIIAKLNSDNAPSGEERAR